MVAPSRWVRCGLAGAEHVTAIAHVIVRHEQLTGKSLEVKKAGDALGDIVEHAKLIGEVLDGIIIKVGRVVVVASDEQDPVVCLRQATPIAVIDILVICMLLKPKATVIR